ncbi:hypothetical protein VP01_1861g1 [Puccinia sorghi]|uniref:Uncharacterized protein n=1 Tax=Puccinia sorghi TaxID=27349 RepID=A0A0L6VDI6_9BASI|nr:hypothetical protein VP01_1861g1 [Puccinia sorghi]
MESASSAPSASFNSEKGACIWRHWSAKLAKKTTKWIFYGFYPPCWPYFPPNFILTPWSRHSGQAVFLAEQLGPTILATHGSKYQDLVYSNVCTSQKYSKQVKNIAKRILLPATNRKKSNKFQELTQIVCILFYFVWVANTSTNKIYFKFVICFKKDHWFCFKKCANAIEGKKLEPLIAGYGFHWEIKSESCRCSYNAREIIDAILSLLGHFKEIQFTQADWMQIKHLNNELMLSYYTNLIHITMIAFQSSYQGNVG